MDAQTMAQDLIEQSSSRTYDLFRINDIVQIKDTGVIGRITKVPREDVAEMVVWWWCGVVVRLIVLAEGMYRQQKSFDIYSWRALCV